MKFLLTSTCLLLISSVAFADQKRGFYVGGAGAYISSESFVSTLDQEDKVYLPALELVGGYRYNNFVGVDVRFAMGTVDQDSNPNVAE